MNEKETEYISRKLPAWQKMQYSNTPSDRLTQTGDKIMETDSKIIGRDCVEWVHMALSYGPVGGYGK